MCMREARGSFLKPALSHSYLALISYWFVRWARWRRGLANESRRSSKPYITGFPAGWLAGWLISSSFYTICTFNDTPLTYHVNLALCPDDTCLCATESKEGYALRQIQRGLNSMAAWCERWNIKINEDKTREIYLSYSDSLLTLNGRNIPFERSVKYVGCNLW
jgi:hypothetical protein